MLDVCISTCVKLAELNGGRSLSALSMVGIASQVTEGYIFSFTIQDKKATAIPSCTRFTWMALVASTRLRVSLRSRYFKVDGGCGMICDCAAYGRFWIHGVVKSQQKTFRISSKRLAQSVLYYQEGSKETGITYYAIPRSFNRSFGVLVHMRKFLWNMLYVRQRRRLAVGSLSFNLSNRGENESIHQMTSGLITQQTAGSWKIRLSCKVLTFLKLESKNSRSRRCTYSWVTVLDYIYKLI